MLPEQNYLPVFFWWSNIFFFVYHSSDKYDGTRKIVEWYQHIYRAILSSRAYFSAYLRALFFFSGQNFQ